MNTISVLSALLGLFAAVAPWVLKALHEREERRKRLDTSLEKWRRLASEDRNRPEVADD